MTALPVEFAAEHRKALGDLSTLVYHDVLGLWKMVSGAPPDAIRDALLEVMPEIAASRGDSAAALAADFYDEVRDEMRVRGKFKALLPEGVSRPRVESLVRWGVDPLYAGNPDEAATFSNIAGGLQKLVAGQSRQTIGSNSIADPEAHGWQRVTAADCCAFCSMLAGRGAVYSKDTVRFASHNDCVCGAVPSFQPGRPLSVEQYKASRRHQTPADRQRVRDYLKGERHAGGAASRRPEGFNAMSRERLEHQISVTSGLKDSDYRTGYLAKLNARLADLK